MSLLDLEKTVQDAENSAGLFDGSRIAQVMQLIQLARQLSSLLNVNYDNPDELSAAISKVLEIAAQAAKLTETQTDDAIVARLNTELQAPEVTAFLAYLVRRLKSGNAA